MEYKELLRKYMAHVLEREGCDYLDQIHWNRDSVTFTEEEIAELERVSAEARK